MTRRALAGVAAALLAVAGAACHRSPPAPSPRLLALREAHDRLHERLEQSVAKDAFLTGAAGDKGEVAVALRSGLVKAVFEQVARRYLDRIVLDLVRDIHVEHGGEIKTKTLLGTITAGTWKVDLTIHRIRGVFRARAPRADFLPGGRVRLGLGVVLENAQGNATLHFTWDATGLASVVCRDFEVTEELEGIVLPDQYPMSGSFVLSAGAQTVLARPEFPDVPFRLRIDLPPASWAKVRTILESQDTFFKCGIALDPDTVMPKLEDLTHKGFDLRLPRSLFRPVELPASLSQSVAVEDHTVDLSVRPSALKITPEAVWMSAAVQARAGRPAGP